ncbi:MAG: TlpA family protein disulfide reductase [Clostridiaceae bacterium]|nr:TlpA family protein disulfide reductase [Clostridiaceae bacterium]
MNKSIKKYLLAALLALLFSVSYTACNSSKIEKPPQSSAAAGENNIITEDEANNQTNNEQKDELVVPDFSLTDLNGNTVKLSDYKGKVVILNFWASWCPPCVGEMPDFDKVNRKLVAGDDAVILAVNLTDGRKETEEKARKFIKDKGYSLNVLLDKDGSAADQYMIYSIPTTYIINRDGTLYTYRDKKGIPYKRFEGAISEEILLDVLEQLDVKL